MTGITQPFKYHRLGVGDDNPRLAHPRHGVAVMKCMTRTHGVFHDEHRLPLLHELHCRLQDTDMRLNAGKHNLFAAAVQDCLAEISHTGAGETGFRDSVGIGRQMITDGRYGGAQPRWILLGTEYRYPQDCSRIEQ